MTDNIYLLRSPAERRAERQLVLMEETRCAHCNGKGLVCHWLWREFGRWIHDRAARPTPKQASAWWATRGYPDQEHLPDSVSLCAMCCGRGARTTPVPVAGMHEAPR